MDSEGQDDDEASRYDLEIRAGGFLCRASREVCKCATVVAVLYLPLGVEVLPHLAK